MPSLLSDRHFAQSLGILVVALFGATLSTVVFVAALDARPDVLSPPPDATTVAARVAPPTTHATLSTLTTHTSGSSLAPSLPSHSPACPTRSTGVAAAAGAATCPSAFATRLRGHALVQESCQAATSFAPTLSPLDPTHTAHEPASTLPKHSPPKTEATHSHAAAVVVVVFHVHFRYGDGR